jgi:hypothetical protein
MMKYFALLLLTASICYAAEERVIKLPEDGQKWHVSVVGDEKDARYQEVIKWFDSGKLKDLKSKVHFHAVPTTDPIYTERYKPNVRGLPTVRVQDAEGYTVYEASKSLPSTGDGLYSAIAISAKEILPWRRHHATPVTPDLVPEPITPDVDPDPSPIDDGGPPVFDETGWDLETWAVIACVILFSLGLGLGVDKAYRKSKQSV